MNNLFEGFTVIHSYTRADMLADGSLVDVSRLAKEAGIKIPVAVTRAVWDGYIVPDEKAKAMGESEDGRLWDCLWMFRLAIAGQRGWRVFFEFLATLDGQHEKISLKAICGPGDNAEPVITIMLLNEDED
ncbi:DUF6573 family protein [Paenibacillus rubinfantis]|uniref:DUF6573 family protein n=1 Tax=Paenibacillus rubinfantis TaxID=1720296 RepID=UPI00073F7607|nr:DUF6573 family protein [Paenibacillus rubinfantis]